MQNILILVIVLMLQTPLLAVAENTSVQIDLSRQTRERITVAIPNFQSFPDQEEDRILALRNQSIFRNDLKLTEMFDIVFASPKDDSDPSRINYAIWKEVGAQWVVKTHYWKDNKTDSILFIFRLFDAVNKRFIVGKRYRAHSMLSHRIMHRFADEMVEQLTGKRGVAETRIAYVAEELGDKEIYLIDFDGKNKQKMTSDHSIVLKPTWSPNGNRLIFTSYIKKRPNLVMMDINKKKKWSVLSLPGLNTAPAWSPDGNKIALVLSRDQNSEIYYLTKKRKLRRLTNHFNIDTSPTWSPDGEKIAFTSDRSGLASPQIYIMDSQLGDKGSVKRITFDSSYNDNPAWSPDGEKIAYTARVGRGFQIKVYNVRTRQTTNFTSGGGSCEEPSWSPDGRFIIYRKRLGNRYNLYLKKIGGSSARKLTEGHHPAWSPYLK
tara:strand:+ start:3438 stop:4739 length:1302 start_codon:yes stop_codon:yes gene_type:complete